MIATSEDLLERLLNHEVRYFGFAAEAHRTDCAWYLQCLDLHGYHDVNRALRLRDDGRGPQAVAREVIGHFRERRQAVVADIDAIAESQGIGHALRSMHVLPVVGNRVLMTYAHLHPPPMPLAPEVTVERTLPADPDSLRVWIETNLNQSQSAADPDYWRYTALEAQYPACRLYLGMLNGTPAGTCDLFSADEWGRIEMVDTLPAYRRRGVASAVVARAVQDSLAIRNTRTYLFTDAGGDGERIYQRLGFVRDGVNVLQRHIHTFE